MRQLSLLVLVITVLTGVVFAQAQKKKSSAGHVTASIPASITAAAKAAAATGCDASLWQHVYHKARLHVVEKCIEVTGVIRHIKSENDGDEHIQVIPDTPFLALLNARNNSAQHESLVIEPVCQGPVTQADAVAACRDFHSPVDIPKKGDKVKIVGSFVFDAEANHGWMEIHPVTSIEVIH